MKYLICLLNFAVLTSGCLSPTINGRNTSKTSPLTASAPFVLSFKTLFDQFMVGLGLVMSDSADDIMYGVVTDTNGNTYTCGTSSSNMFATGAGGGDVVISKFDNNGNMVWGVQWVSTAQGLFSTPTNFDVCYSIKMGPNNSLYLGGYTTGQLFGNGTYGSGSLRDAWVARVSAVDGSIMWGRQLTANAQPAAPASA